MIRREFLLGLRRGFAATLFFGVVGCTERDIESVENSLWKMFAGHPKPIILNKPDPPIYCYATIGEPQCYDEPLEGERAPPIQ